jgi:hypothetical protein
LEAGQPKGCPAFLLCASKDQRPEDTLTKAEISYASEVELSGADVTLRHDLFFWHGANDEAIQMSRKICAQPRGFRH